MRKETTIKTVHNVQEWPLGAVDRCGRPENDIFSKYVMNNKDKKHFYLSYRFLDQGSVHTRQHDISKSVFFILVTVRNTTFRSVTC